MNQLNNCLSRVYSIDVFGNMRIIKLPRLVERLQKKIIPIFLPIGRISKKALYRTSLGWFPSVYSKIWMLEEHKLTLSLLKLNCFIDNKKISSEASSYLQRRFTADANEIKNHSTTAHIYACRTAGIYQSTIVKKLFCR